MTVLIIQLTNKKVRMGRRMYVGVEIFDSWPVFSVFATFCFAWFFNANKS